MPGLDVQALAHASRSSASNKSVHIEDGKLFMPSELSESQRRLYCTAELSSIEQSLRYAEASDSLNNLRRQLRTRTFTNRFKRKNVTGQKNNTRSREKQGAIDDGIKASQLQYGRARQALLALRGPGEWENELRVLHQNDVHGLNERALTDHEKAEEERVRALAGVVDNDDIDDIRVDASPVTVGEGHRRLSWIWYATSTGEDMRDPTMRAGESFYISMIFYLT